MDALQDFLTTAIIALEYLFFGYIALAFVIYSFQRQAEENGRQFFTKPAQQKPLIVPPVEQPSLLAPAN